MFRYLTVDKHGVIIKLHDQIFVRTLMDSCRTRCLRYNNCLPASAASIFGLDGGRCCPNINPLKVPNLIFAAIILKFQWVSENPVTGNW